MTKLEEKYIRKKNEIFEYNPLLNVSVYKDTIQADTIEELCDEFVLVAPYRFRKPKTATELDKDFDEMRYFYTDKDDTIYGAIWIFDDNGVPTLKSVAKMNDRGELELL